jgi:hypothetical protein
MAARYRFSLDIEDIRDRIEKVRTKNIWWQEMSLSAKIRTLIIERVEQLEEEDRSTEQPRKEIASPLQKSSDSK